MRLFLLVLAILVGCAPAFAAGASRQALAVELIQVVSGEPSVDAVIAKDWASTERELRTANPRISAATLAALKATMKQSLTELQTKVFAQAAAVYARELSAGELQQLIAFYKSPLGAKLLRTETKVSVQTLAALKDSMRKLFPKILAELLADARRAGPKVAA